MWGCGGGTLWMGLLACVVGGLPGMFFRLCVGWAVGAGGARAAWEDCGHLGAVASGAQCVRAVHSVCTVCACTVSGEWGTWGLR